MAKNVITGCKEVRLYGIKQNKKQTKLINSDLRQMKKLSYIKYVLVLVLSLYCALPVCSQTVTPPHRYRVAACDWMMLKRQKLGEFKLAQEIGADGVEVDMGALGKRVLFDNQLRTSEQAAKFQAAAREYGVEVPSVAMSGFFAQSFLTRENYQDLLKDCFQTMRLFGSKVAFLPLGGSGKTWQQPGADYEALVKRLRIVGEMAQREGVTIGVRTGMGAKFDKQLLKDVKNDHIKVYYNFQDAADNGRDICRELKTLGKKRIIQIHASNTDGVNLPEDSKIDMAEIKKTLDKMGWSGWLVVERSRDTTRVRDVKYNFGRNVAYLKEIFQDKQ